MVAEPWILKMGNQVSSNLKNSLLLEPSKRKTPKSSDTREAIGILSSEVANTMSTTVHLYKSLTYPEISKLKAQILSSDGVRKLVSDDESCLLELAIAEKLEELNRVASVVSRMGKKCCEPALQGFEHVYGDTVSGMIDVRELGFLVKDMEGMLREMERYVKATANLYGEMEVLDELEQATKKFQQNQHEESQRAYELLTLTWQKQDVRHLMEISLRNQTYDKVVELLARTVCTAWPDDKASQLTCSLIPHRLGEMTNKKYAAINIGKVPKLKTKRVGWLNMPRSSSFGECCMAIKTYGRHNLWNFIGLALLADPS